MSRLTIGTGAIKAGQYAAVLRAFSEGKQIQKQGLEGWEDTDIIDLVSMPIYRVKPNTVWIRLWKWTNGREVQVLIAQPGVSIEKMEAIVMNGALVVWLSDPIEVEVDA